MILKPLLPGTTIVGNPSRILSYDSRYVNKTMISELEYHLISDITMIEDNISIKKKLKKNQCSDNIGIKLWDNKLWIPKDWPCDDK